MIDESKLIFIISQPRSGSTLLQKLVSNNDHVDTVSEPWLLLPLLSPFKPELVNARYNYRVAMQGVLDYLQKKQAGDEFREEIKRLALRLYKVGRPDQYFVDKTPRYYEIIPEITSFFPRARFLVLKRNLFASLHSMIFTWTPGRIDFKTLDQFYRDFLAAPFLIQEFCENTGAGENVLTVKYEDIISAPEIHVENIYKWLGIPFSRQVLDIGRNEKVKGIFGDDVYKKKPLTSVSAESEDHWKHKLGDKTLRRFFHDYQEYLSPDFIRHYGYEAENFGSLGWRFGKSEFADYVASLKAGGKL